MIDNLDNIKKLIDDTIEIQKKYLVFLDSEIDYIIDNKIIDDRKVEAILDDLLGLLQTDEVLYLYKKICKYYYFISPSLVTTYIYIYKDMYLDEETNKIMKKE